jgi:hypothetical protein
MRLLATPAAKTATVRLRQLALPGLRSVAPLRYTDADPYRVLQVPSTSVTHLQRRWEGPICLPWLEGGGVEHLPAVRRRWHAGIVLDGDWDRAVSAFDDYHLTRVLRARFLDGAAWADIPYIKKALRKVRAGEAAWGGRCRSETDVHERCAYLDDLHERLRADGYRSDVAAPSGQPAFSHFLVNIGRDGTIIRNNDGKHRIILARLIGLPRLSARVLVRHREWQRIRLAIAAGDLDLGDRYRRHADAADLIAEQFGAAG